MSRQFAFLLAAILTPVFLAATAQAQFGGNSGGFGGSGGFGNQGSLGGAGFGGGAGGLGPNQMGSSVGGTSSGTFGSRTLGSGVQGSTGRSGNSSQFGAGSAMGGNMFGAGATTGQMGAATTQSGVTGSERFTREGRQPGAFVGADSGDAVSLLSQMQGSAIGGMQGMQGLQGLQGGLNGMNGMNGRNGQMNQFNQLNNQNNRNNQRVLVRTTLRFVPQNPSAPLGAPSSVASARMENRFAKLPQFQRLGPLNVAVEGQTAVLRGTVSSEHERALAERVALLEPGISAVQNEIVVDPAVTTNAN